MIILIKYNSLLVIFETFNNFENNEQKIVI